MEKLTEQQIEKRLVHLEGWSYGDGCIQKSYQFKDFKQAFSTMTRIAFECEAMNHHPDWTNVYNSLTIQLNTHDANGVTEKDFELAKAIEDIVNT